MIVEAGLADTNAFGMSREGAHGGEILRPLPGRLPGRPHNQPGLVIPGEVVALGETAAPTGNDGGTPQDWRTHSLRLDSLQIDFGPLEEAMAELDRANQRAVAARERVLAGCPGSEAETWPVGGKRWTDSAAGTRPPALPAPYAVDRYGRSTGEAGARWKLATSQVSAKLETVLVVALETSPVERRKLQTDTGSARRLRDRQQGGEKTLATWHPKGSVSKFFHITRPAARKE